MGNQQYHAKAKNQSNRYESTQAPICILSDLPSEKNTAQNAASTPGSSGIAADYPAKKSGLV
jgi:hypothetical protein